MSQAFVENKTEDIIGAFEEFERILRKRKLIDIPEVKSLVTAIRSSVRQLVSGQINPANEEEDTILINTHGLVDRYVEYQRKGGNTRLSRLIAEKIDELARHAPEQAEEVIDALLTRAVDDVVTLHWKMVLNEVELTRVSPILRDRIGKYRKIVAASWGGSRQELSPEDLKKADDINSEISRRLAEAIAKKDF